MTKHSSSIQNEIALGLLLTDIPKHQNLSHLTQLMNSNGFHFLLTPIVHPQSSHSSTSFSTSNGSKTIREIETEKKQQLLENEKNHIANTFDPENLLINEPSSHVHGIIQPPLLTDATTTQYFKRQVQWAKYTGLYSLILPCHEIAFNDMSLLANYARLTNLALSELTFAQVLIHVKSSSPNAWENWNFIRSLCAYHNHLGVCLELDSPDSLLSVDKKKKNKHDNHHTISNNNSASPILSSSRWYGEPVKMIVLSKNVFLINKKGYAVLSKEYQEFLTPFVKRNCSLVIKQEDNESLTLNEEKNGNYSTITKQQSKQQNVENFALFREYLCYFERSVKTAMHPNEHSAKGYHDYLQEPLQPLKNHLESATYEVFETDPVKYIQYEEAIYQALLDRKQMLNHCDKIVVMVVGAGRGPLVQRALIASERSGVPIDAFAIEKNPNALVILKQKNRTIWDNKVTLVHTDMRYWETSVRADILVSELLGSFGDNELSPECLDGAQKFLKPDGISIPYNYTAYCSPITAAKLYQDVSAYKTVKNFEMPYVVLLRSIHEIDEPKPLWTFTHPYPNYVKDNSSYSNTIDATTRSSNENVKFETRNGYEMFNQHNTRFQAVRFQNGSESVTMHGIAGYFESVLYKNVLLSILPKTHSKGMMSWFPIYFPIKTPIHLPPHSMVDIHFWRCSDSSRVWYEWSVVPYDPDRNMPILDGRSEIHNVGGKNYAIGLSI